MIKKYLNSAIYLTLRSKYTSSEKAFFKQQNNSKTSTQEPGSKLFNRNKKDQDLSSNEQQFQQVSAKTNIEDVINKINLSNKYFLGVKLNTNYLKIDNVVMYGDVKKLVLNSKNISDLPFDISKYTQNNQNIEKSKQQNIVNDIIKKKKSWQIVRGRARIEPIVEKMQGLVNNFFKNMIKKQRLQNVQPNFELQIIKTLNALAQRYSFKIKEKEKLPGIIINNVTLFRGIFVNRNQNYSQDSYDKNQLEAEEGIISYLLYLQKKEEYPEIEWYSTKAINARFQVTVKNAPLIQVYDNNILIGSNQRLNHQFIFETDLVIPPINSETKLTPEEYLKSYRLDYNKIIITNVDRKNSYYPLTFTQQIKKTTLINKII